MRIENVVLRCSIKPVPYCERNIYFCNASLNKQAFNFTGEISMFSFCSIMQNYLTLNSDSSKQE